LLVCQRVLNVLINGWPMLSCALSFTDKSIYNVSDNIRMNTSMVLSVSMRGYILSTRVTGTIEKYNMQGGRCPSNCTIVCETTYTSANFDKVRKDESWISTLTCRTSNPLSRCCVEVCGLQPNLEYITGLLIF